MPELAIPHELVLRELILPACEIGRSLVAEHSRDSPALLELGEVLTWGIESTTVREGITCWVLGEAVPVCDHWHTDWNADSFQIPEG